VRFAEVVQQTLRQTTIVLGPRAHAADADDVVLLTTGEARGHRHFQRAAIDGGLHASIALPQPRDLQHQVALFFKIAERFDDALTRLADRAAVAVNASTRSTSRCFASMAALSLLKPRCKVIRWNS